jgi:hypothetical protein
LKSEGWKQYALLLKRLSTIRIFKCALQRLSADLGRPRGLLETDLEVAPRSVSGQVYYLVPCTPLPPLPVKSRKQTT